MKASEVKLILVFEKLNSVKWQFDLFLEFDNFFLQLDLLILFTTV